MTSPARRAPGAPVPTTAPITGAVPTFTLQAAKPEPIHHITVMYAAEKFGKTTLGAYSPDPVIIQVGDLGYQTLVNAGAVPQLPLATVTAWLDLLSLLDVFAVNHQGRKTLVIDGLVGCEKLCHQFICDTIYDGNWGDGGFMAYHKGYELSVPEWMKFMARLEKIRDSGMDVIILGHSRTKEVKNPIGANYDRFEPDVYPKTWGPTARTADIILFGKFHTIVQQAARDKAKSIAEAKGKAIGGIDRVIFTSPCDAWVAGNRYGMDSEIWLNGVAPEDMWNTIAAQIGRQKATAP